MPDSNNILFLSKLSIYPCYYLNVNHNFHTIKTAANMSIYASVAESDKFG